MKKFILFMFLSFAVFSLKPISEKNAKLISLGSGLATAGVATYLVKKINKEIGFASVSGALATGLIAGYLTYKQVQEFTPEAKFNLALDIIQEIEKFDLVSKEFENHAAYLTFIMGDYKADWPLLNAVGDLNGAINKLKLAKSFLDQACELAKKYKLNDLLIKINDLYKRLEKLMEYSCIRSSLIKSWPMYNDQDEKYEKSLKDQREEWEKKREQEKIIQNFEDRFKKVIKEAVKEALAEHAKNNFIGDRN